MSIASEIARLQQAKADLKTAINSKGGNITTERIDQFASEVAALGVAPQVKTWVINENVNLSAFYIETNFTSNNESFYKLEVSIPSNELYYFKTGFPPNPVWSSNTGWVIKAYRTITFETAPTGELLAWLEANAVKIDALPAVVELTQAQYDALPQGKTWVLNKILNHETFQATDISFTSNGLPYTSIMRVYAPEGNPPYIILKYGWRYVYYDDEGWDDQAYRTITFDTAPTGDLLAWLEANAVLQDGYDDNTYYLIVEGD